MERTERAFRSVSDITLNGQPGDRFTEHKDRTVSTYVFKERINDTKAVLDTISTSHYGKAEYVGRPHKCYISDVRPIPTEVEGVFVSQSFGLYDGKTIRLHVVNGVPRYNARTIAAAHQAAVEAYEAL